MKIVFFGTPEFSAAYLRALLSDKNFDVVGVVTQPDEPLGRKKTLTPPSTKIVAAEHDIPVLQPTKLKNEVFAQELNNLHADVFVIIAYGRIIPQNILDIPHYGCVNVHPSLLPKLRGPSPIISAIAQGETTTGVTIMKLDAQMDHGPILAQTSFEIDVNETASTLTQKVIDHGAPLLITTLKDYIAGNITPREQDHDAATFCMLLTREDGHVNFHEPSNVIGAKIRAYNPWPGVWAVWRRKENAVTLKFFRATPITAPFALQPGEVKISDGRLFIGTSTTAMDILELQASGGTRMSAKAFLQGHAGIDGTTLA